MPKSKFEPSKTMYVELFFPLTRKKKAEERKTLLRKMKSLTEKDKELSVNKISSKKYDLTLFADEFLCTISFEKPISFKIQSNQHIEKIEKRINNFANKIVNYLNMILGDSAKDAKSFMSWLNAEEKGFNLSKAFVEDTKLAKINQLIKKNVEPKGIMFEFKSGEYTNSVMQFHSENVVVFSGFSKSIYKGILPWDVIEREFKNRKDIINIVQKLSQKEF